VTYDNRLTQYEIAGLPCYPSKLGWCMTQVLNGQVGCTCPTLFVDMVTPDWGFGQRGFLSSFRSYQVCDRDGRLRPFRGRDAGLVREEEMLSPIGFPSDARSLGPMTSQLISVHLSGVHYGISTREIGESGRKAEG
jgi:hypothetical protein